MGTRLVPIRFDLIEEGRLAKSLDDSVAEAIAALITHAKKYEEKAKAAKAVVNLKLTIQFDGADECDYSIKGDVSIKLPGRPAHMSKAILEVEQTGEETLFVRASGSDGVTPRQSKLATDDGRPIDLQSGEARPA